MIEAKELRVGNWLTSKSFPKGPSQIRSIDSTIVKLGDYLEGYENLKPIPLTAGILIKFGFVLQSQRKAIYIKGRLKLWLGHNGAIAYLKNEDVDESYYIPNNPQSVHQLQNLYYAIHKEELPINFQS